MRKALAALAAILIIFGMTACGGDDSDDNGYLLHLGFSPFALGSEYQMMIHDQMVAQAAERNIRLTIMSPEGDIVTQVTQVENMIAMGVDAILIYPVDQSAVTEALIDARSQGIRVVVNDAMYMNMEAYDVLIEASAIEMGMVANQLASDWIDENFPDAAPGTVEVAVFGLWLTEYWGLRSDVMVDMPSVNPKATVVHAFSPTAEHFMTEIPNYAHMLLQTNPDIAVVLSFTDGFAIMVDEVFMQYDLDFSRIGHFTVDRTDEGLARIASSVNNESTIRGTAVPGLNIVSEMLDAVQGLLDDRLDANRIYPVEVIPVTAANVHELIDN